MIKDATYKQKFTLIHEWMPLVVDAIKKDLKVDHLAKNMAFLKKHFPGKNVNKLTVEELSQAYYAAIQEENDENLAEAIAQRWMIKNSEIYHFFETKLTAIDKNFSDMQEIPQNKAEEIAKESSAQFTPIKTYIFCVFNSVVFPQKVFDQLKEQSKQFQHIRETEKIQKDEQDNIDQLKKEHEREIARLTDKYEKKLSGLQKKYVQDVESLKKQISNLQRKMTPQTCQG